MARRKAESARNPLARIARTPDQAERLLQAGLGSAFAIARSSVEHLLSIDPELSAADAQALHQRASALAVLAARHYREQRLTATQAADPSWRTGLRALVDGPTFESLFNPSWSENCTPDAIEATTSPAAYVAALFKWVTEEVETKADPAKRIPLAQRRPDLPGLVLDNQSLSRVEPTIGLVNEILERAARKHLDDHSEFTRSVDDALLESRYPFALPFERYMSQITGVLLRKKYSLGDLIRQLDPAFPYFSQGGLHSQRSDEALHMDLAIGPEQRGLLLEAPYFPRGARRLSSRSVQTRVNPRTLLRESAQVAQNNFYPRHYGVETQKPLQDLSVFCQRTGLDQAGVESLLSIETCAPVASPNVVGLDDASPARFGSVYINAGLEPVMGVASDGGKHSLTDANDDHFDRVQRMVRLARWLDLSFGETDQIIDAALRAEYGEAGRGQAISDNTLRALGLFCRLRRDFKVSAEDFAALLQGVALYARGGEKPQFDRVFNDPALFSEPLVLDDSAFSIVPGSDAEYRKILHLCGALGIGFDTYLYVARYIAQAGSDQQRVRDGEGETLLWSHAVISAFYRFTRLAAWIGLTSIEVIALLQLMGRRGHHYVARLVTPALAVYQHSDLSDTLSVVQGLTDAVHWCREQEVTVDWLYQRLMPLATLATASERDRELLGQIHVRMLPTIITSATFIEAGVPMIAGADRPTAIDWFDLLKDFISTDGLVHDISDYETSEAFEAALTAQIKEIISDLELPPESGVLVKVSSLVMDARAAQQSLVWESLTSAFGGTSELSRELLAWAGGTCYVLLHEVLRIHSAMLPGQLPGTGIEVMAEVLALLARLAERAAIVEAFALSPLAVRSYLRHPQWFGVERAQHEAPAPVVEVDLRQLHALAQYRHLLEFARQPEPVMLDYLALVDSLPPDLSEADLQMIREDAAGKVAAFTGFGIRDTLDTAREVTADGIVTTVLQLDHLVRIRQACETLQLSTSAVVALSRLLSNSSRNEYREAAHGALSSLGADGNGQVGLDQGELGQSETSWIVVDRERLVARTAERARCLLTVKNFFDQPMAGVTVTWHTDLGTLATAPSQQTDENGQVWIELMAGDLMGTAQVTARFGLDRQVRAPLILIDCDELSLTFRNPGCSSEEALAGNLGEVEYSVELLDDYDNPGRDRVLHWSTDLGTFVRPQTRCDDQGFATARLSSLSSGFAEVEVRFEYNDNRQKFEPVEFLEQPYFQYVRFSAPAATTQPVEVVCRVVNLDGSPVAGVTVTWSADLGGFDSPAQSVTAADGIARINYLSDKAGVVWVSVNAKVDEETLRQLQSEPTTVYLLPQIVESAPEHQYYAMRQARPAAFSVVLEPAVSGYPVEWRLGEELLAKSFTGQDGVAQFSWHFKEEHIGEQVITASTVGGGDKPEFRVTVMEAHNRLEITLADDHTGVLPLAGEGVGFVVDRIGGKGRFIIRAMRDDGAGDDNAWVKITRLSGATPDNLNIKFQPALGEAASCDEQGEASLELDCSAASFEANSDQYSNEFTLLATSNLGVTAQFTLRLRDLIDLSLCEMKLVVSDAEVLGGICGYIERADGAPLQLRDGHSTLRASSSGNPNEHFASDVLLDSKQRGYVVFRRMPIYSKERCHFYLDEGLGKRLHLLESGVREFKAGELLSDLSVSYESGTADAIVVGDDAVYIDARKESVLKARITNAGVPVGGVAWFPALLSVANATLAPVDLLSDSSGNLVLHCSTKNLVLKDGEDNDHDIAAGIGPFNDRFKVALREFFKVSGSASFKKGSISSKRLFRFGLRFARVTEGLPYYQTSNFSGVVRLNELKWPFTLTSKPSLEFSHEEEVHAPEFSGAPIWVTLTSGRFLLFGETSIPVEDKTEAL